jgi:pilus assembly protein CpaB
MKMKSLILLAMAVGCGLVAMLGVQQVLSGDKKPVEETAKVLVAVTGIMPGQPLDDTNVTFKEWPKNQIPEGAVTNHEQYAERSLRVSAVPNEVIMTAKLNEKGVFGGSSEIPEGMRVATVPVNVTKTHSGLILPGDRVDVVVTYTATIPNRGQIRKAKTILQYIEIFATDNIRQSAVPNGENKEVAAKNISLIVTPEQYNVLMLAESKGTLSLALRHRGDDSEVHPPDIDDTMFDGIQITKGQEKSSSEVSVQESADKSGSVQVALDNEQAKTAGGNSKQKGAKVAAKDKDSDAKSTWTLKVFEGDKVREEEVELPENSAETAEASGGKWGLFFHHVFSKSK